MFNSVSLFVINGQSVSSELLKSALPLLIHCYRIIIISLFAIPLTLAIESLLVIAESAFFLFVGVKRAESNNSSCFKIIYCRLHALLLASISFISWASQVLYRKRKFAKSTRKIIKVILNRLVFLQLLMYCIDYFNNVIFTFDSVLLLCSGDIHPNPGTVKRTLNFCHWNLNSVLAHNKIKISLLEAYDSVYHNDIIALTETQLNQRIPDDEILINGFSSKPFRKDDPSGDRYRGICVYYNLPIKRRSDLEMLLTEGIVTETVLGRKKFFFVAVYRPHHMSADDFEMFTQRIELLTDYMRDEKPHCIIFAGDFNSRCKQWWPEDDEDPQGIAVDEFIESNAPFQLIDQPTHILENSKSCIDLIITNQPSLFVEFGVYPSLFRGCHHEIIFGKVAVSVPHPPPYKRRMWDYKVADVSSIRESLMNIDRYFEFGDLEPNLMVEKFTEIILSIIAENVPNRVITINEKDPPWITKEVKTAIRRKHRIYNKYIKRGSKQEDWEQVRIVRNQTTHR